MQFGRVPGGWSFVGMGPTPARLLAAPAAAVIVPHTPSGSPLTRTSTEPSKAAQMNLRFDPRESRRIFHDAPLIGFAQTCQIVADGKVVKPGRFFSKWAFRDAFTMASGVFLDVMDGADSPYYEWTVYGHRYDRGGTISTEPAVMNDSPQIGQAEPIMFDPATHPNGFKTAVFKLQTFAIARGAPPDRRWFEGALWEWAITWQEHQAGQPGRASVVELNVPLTSDMVGAFALFCAATGKSA